MSVAFERKYLRDDVIQKCPVVAHQQDGARVILEQRLKQLQRFHIEIIGRLIQHQQIGGPRKQARQQQAIALSTGERFHFCTRALRRKQEIAKIADDMFPHRLVTDR